MKCTYVIRIDFEEASDTPFNFSRFRYLERMIKDAFRFKSNSLCSLSFKSRYVIEGFNDDKPFVQKFKSDLDNLRFY